MQPAAFASDPLEDPDAFAQAVFVAERPATELRVSTSARTLARGAAAFELGLARLADAGHRVTIVAVALPERSLASAESIAALATLLELEARWPAAFCFREADFDAVLWTPQTRIVDVELELRIIRVLGLSSTFAGLLRAPALRFDDPMVARLAHACAELDGEPETMVEQALAHIDALRSTDATIEARVVGDPALWERCEQTCDLAVRRSLKPIRRPSVPATALAEFEAEVRRRFGPELALTSAPIEVRPGYVDVIYGFSAADVDEFVTLTTQATSSNPPDDLDAINRRIGALLGYPPCCVDAFIESASTEIDLAERTLLARRIGAGTLDPRWPLLLLVYEHYLPCSLHCQRSLAKADALAAALCEAGLEAPNGGWARIVFLAELERPGNVAVLLREASDADGFAYRLIAANHTGDRLAPVLAGDRLAFEGPLVRVFCGDQPLHTYAGNVGLFDVEREWGDSRWFAARAKALAEVERAAVEAPPEPEVEAPLGVFDRPPGAARVRAEIVRILPAGSMLARCEAGPAGDSEHEWVRAQIDGEVGRFVLTVVPRAIASGSMFVAGVAARFDPSARLPAQRAVVATLAQRFDARAHPLASSSPEAEVHALVLAATQPASGEFVRFGNFAPCWPICDAAGTTRLALINNGCVLELIIALRSDRRRWPGATRRCAVGYSSDSGIETPAKRAAFARFVERLRSIDDADD